MAEVRNIYQRLSAITAEISNVAKNLAVGSGQNSYKAVGEADVLAAVKPIEAKHGIYSYPASRQVIDSGVLTSVKEYKGEQKETKQFYVRVETVYRFVNVDKPEEFIDVTSYGDGVDTQDKAPGKAMTYSDKYALLKAYKIVTGDDPDQNASDEMKGYQRKEAQKKPDVITEKEQEILRNMCGKAGRSVESVFPKGLNLTSAQYTQAVTQLQGLIDKKAGK